MQYSMKRNMLWNSIGNLLYIGSLWIITVAVSRIDTTYNDAGVLSVAMSVSATLQTLALFGVRNYQVSDIDCKYSDTTYFNLRSLTSLSSLLICVIFSFAAGYGSDEFLAILFYMLFRLAESVSEVMHGIAQRRGRLDIAGKSLLVKSVLLLAAFFLGYLLSGVLYVGLMLMAISSFLSTFLFDYPLTKRIASFSLAENPKLCFPLLLETLPLCVYTFLFSAIATAPKLILEIMTDSETLGIYSTVFAPVTLLQAATGYIYNPFAPSFAEKLKARDFGGIYKLIFKICLAMLAITGVVALLGLLLGEWALVLLYTESIRAHTYLLLPIILVTAILSFLGFFCMLLTVIRDFRGIIIGCSLGFASSLVLSLIMTSKDNLNMTSFALIISGALATLTVAIFAFLKLRSIKNMKAESALPEEGDNYV